MGRKPLAWPAGVEPVGSKIRIRFMWKKRRRCETLEYPQTPQGIQAAAGLRATVIQLSKLGVLTDEKYAELFPASSYIAHSRCPTFGQYSQAWLDSREITAGTRRNYVWALNLYWMPGLASMPMDEITTIQLRDIMAATPWKSRGARRNALIRLRTIMRAALADGVIEKDPTASLEIPRRVKPLVDPFSQEEAEQIIDWLYTNLSEQARIYACYFEFAFYSGMRPAEIMALRWDEVDMDLKTVHVCRVVADGAVQERTKTGSNRVVLLNSRALAALHSAREIAKSRSKRLMAFSHSPYVFPPAMKAEFIKQTSITDSYFKTALRALGVRDRPQYNCRHTYATLCLMSGMNPAFIATQLGHSMQMLLSTYARWLNSRADWDELGKLESRQVGTKVVQLPFRKVPNA